MSDNDALKAARHLAEHGVPIFLAQPVRNGDGEWDPAATGPGIVGGYRMPKRWQQTEPDPTLVDRWEPGMALCAVMGHVVDALDLDPRNGGELEAELWPRSYGRQRTPSGGTHDLIASLGVRSKDGVEPGVDLKAGTAGDGHGFVFLAPTVKLAKGTGELVAYEWEQEPDLSPLLIAGDDSGAQLRALYESLSRQQPTDGPAYDGPTYDELTPEQRERADDYVATQVEDWRWKLGAASGWPEGKRNHAGKGWEVLARDSAWTLAVLAATPWTGLTEEEAERLYEEMLPDVMAADPKCAGKWGPGLVDKAAQDVGPPPWAPRLPARTSDREDWFMKAIMPTRSYGLLSGPIGAGKSSVLGYVVAELTKKQHRVRYCVTDEPEASARHRLQLLDADLSRVTFSEVPDLTRESDMESYARACAEDGVDLVVFDLLQSANAAYEENRPEKVKLWVSQLVEHFCHTYGVGILGTHHWNNNAKAGSAMARLSGAGAIASAAEFLWSVAISNDKAEQVWSVHARRRVSQAMNFHMEGTRHVVEVVAHPFTDEPVELAVFTVAYGCDTERTAHDVARQAEREFAEGGDELSPRTALARFLSEPRRRPEVEQFLFWLTGKEYSPRTVVARLREAGAVQCDREGSQSVTNGKYWVGEARIFGTPGEAS